MPGSRATATTAAGDAFEALGDPNRRAIVELLASGGERGRSVGELAAELPISRPAVSRHLRLLKQAGLVVEEPRGTRRIYRLHDEIFGKTPRGQWLDVDEGLADELRGRLTRLGYEGELEDAFTRWAATENLEERVDGAGQIDPVVLDALRSKT